MSCVHGPFSRGCVPAPCLGPVPAARGNAPPISCCGGTRRPGGVGFLGPPELHSGSGHSLQAFWEPGVGSELGAPQACGENTPHSRSPFRRQRLCPRNTMSRAAQRPRGPGTRGSEERKPFGAATVPRVPALPSASAGWPTDNQTRLRKPRFRSQLGPRRLTLLLQPGAGTPQKTVCPANQRMWLHPQGPLSRPKTKGAGHSALPTSRRCPQRAGNASMSQNKGTT